MDSLCSRSVVALALLIGSAGGALLAPAAGAGDRIEFSAPAIPLAVPQPEVEIKRPPKMAGPADSPAGWTDGADMVVAPQVIIRRSKAGARSAWASNPQGNNDPDQREADDWFSARPEPNQLTNSSNLNMQRGSETRDGESLLRQRYDAGRESGRNGSSLGPQSGLDRDNEAQGERPGPGFASEKEGSFLTKALGHEPSLTYRFSGGRFVPFMDEYRMFSSGGYEHRMNDLGLPADSAHDQALPSGDANFTPFDESRSQQSIGQNDATGQGYLRAWEQPATRPSQARIYSNPEQAKPSRFVAPEQPAVLRMPKRPGDP